MYGGVSLLIRMLESMKAFLKQLLNYHHWTLDSDIFVFNYSVIFFYFWNIYSLYSFTYNYLFFFRKPEEFINNLHRGLQLLGSLEKKNVTQLPSSFFLMKNFFALKTALTFMCYQYVDQIDIRAGSHAN